MNARTVRPSAYVNTSRMSVSARRNMNVEDRDFSPRQEEVALWTGTKGNGSIHDGDGTIGHGLTMDVAKGLSICERTHDACIAHLDTVASEQEEGKSSLIDRCQRRR